VDRVPHARHRARLAAFLLLGAAIAGAASSAAADRPASQPLRDQRAALGARARNVLYDLYAQDAALAQARTALANQQRRVANLHDQAQTAQEEANAARQSLRSAQRALAAQVTAWYKSSSSSTDPVQLLLSSGSIDQAIAKVDAIDHVAALDKRVIAETRSARARLDAATRSLQAAHQEAAAEQDALAQRVSSLAAERVQKQQLLASLQAQRGAVSRRIVQLDAQAQAAASLSQQLVAGSSRVPAAGDSTPAPVPSGPDPSSASGSTLTVTATAYSLSGTTATGLPTGPGICATDPSVIPLGTRFSVPGYGECLAADTGSAVIGDTIDVWMPNAQAMAWGRQTVTITLG
jgi:3D (Asp-Asp-Asp) domain-containing protein/septal ring factor EnvC (AmiA/AmiB activator)